MVTSDVAGFVDLDGHALGTLAPKDRILKTASDLFYRFSIHSVGIDRIIAESGVAKMTFYRHFPSKANLVAAYLRHKNAVWLDMLARSTDRPGLSPTERILAIFDALGGSFKSPSFRGCPFMKGMAEFGPDANSPDIQATISAHFQGLRNFVESLIAPLALSDPERTVIQILSLIQGSIVMAQAATCPAVAEANREGARLLLQEPGSSTAHIAQATCK